MRLRLKLVLLAAVPLLLSVALIAAAVRHQEQALARREQALVQQAYMAARQAELKHYVDLAVSTIRPLYERRHQDPRPRPRPCACWAAWTTAATATSSSTTCRAGC
jgi:two-component system NarL family sensor kinase